MEQLDETVVEEEVEMEVEEVEEVEEGWPI